MMLVKSGWPQLAAYGITIHVGAHQDKVLHMEEGDDARIVHVYGAYLNEDQPRPLVSA